MTLLLLSRVLTEGHSEWTLYHIGPLHFYFGRKALVFRLVPTFGVSFFCKARICSWDLAIPQFDVSMFLSSLPLVLRLLYSADLIAATVSFLNGGFTHVTALLKRLSRLPVAADVHIQSPSKSNSSQCFWLLF